jgi:dephospho-CoA kinase
MKIYGLTGGIGAGKSEASSGFADAGVPVIDADSIAHETLLPGGAVAEAIVKRFGEGVLVDGAIDRAKLGNIVFNDREKLRELNGLVHPAVQLEIASLCAEYAEADKEAVIIETALHGENGKLGESLDGLILVTCPAETRIRRVIENRGLSEAEAKSRVDSQTPPENKLSLANWVIDNSGSVEELERQVDAVAKEL